MTKELEYLIKNLSKNETGYFKKSLYKYSLSKTTHSEKLFDAIKAGKKIASKQAYRLYWQVTDVMCEYYSANTSDREINTAFILVNVLLGKGDRINAKKILMHAIQISLKNQQYEYFLHLTHILKIRIFDLYEIKEIPSVLAEFDAKIAYAKKRLDEESQLVNDYIKTYLLVRSKNIARNIQEIKAYAGIIKHKIYTTNNDKDLSEYSFLLKYNILTTVYYMTGDSTNAYNTSKLLLGKITPVKVYSYIKLKLIIEALNNHYIICVEMNKQNELEDIINAIKTIKDSKQVKNKLFVIQRLNELSLLYNLSVVEIKPAAEINKEQLEMLEKTYGAYSLQMPLNKKNMFCFMFAAIYMKINQYKKARLFLSNILNTKNTSLGIAIASRFLDLILLFETKEYIYLQQRIKNLYRFLKQNQRLMQFEQNVLKLLSGILSGKIKSEKDFFMKFNDILQEIKNNKNEKNTLKYFDYEKWVQMHLKKQF